MLLNKQHCLSVKKIYKIFLILSIRKGFDTIHPVSINEFLALMNLLSTKSTVLFNKSPKLSIMNDSLILNFFFWVYTGTQGYHTICTNRNIPWQQLLAWLNVLDVLFFCVQSHCPPSSFKQASLMNYTKQSISLMSNSRVRRVCLQPCYHFKEALWKMFFYDTTSKPLVNEKLQQSMLWFHFKLSAQIHSNSSVAACVNLLVNKCAKWPMD